jgi:hypothetical protein
LSSTSPRGGLSCRYGHLSVPLTFLDYRRARSTDGWQKTFALVVFAHYYVAEQVVIEGTRCKRLGKPTRKRLDRATVEAIVGQKV